MATSTLGRVSILPTRPAAAFAELQARAPGLNPVVLERALVAAYTARRVGFGRRRPFLTVIDHSLPSDARRMWVFNLRTRRLVRQERVAHGEGSGVARPLRWSNGVDSRASSLGLFVTRETYRGRRGHSLRMIGLDPGHNHRAYRRSLVFHGAGYMTDTYRNTHGGIFGRSHGCPALDPAVSREVIDILEGGSLVFVHGPDPKWLRDSAWAPRACPRWTPGLAWAQGASDQPSTCARGWRGARDREPRPNRSFRPPPQARSLTSCSRQRSRTPSPSPVFGMPARPGRPRTRHILRTLCTWRFSSRAPAETIRRSWSHFLHDVLEDTVTSAQERLEVAAEIEDRWGPEVARSVRTLTEPKRDRQGRPVPWRARKEAYLEQLSVGDRRAWMVSTADKLHNLETLLIALERDGEGVWQRFWSGPEDNRWFYDKVLETVAPRLGEDHILIRALGAAVTRFAAHLEPR